MKIPFAIQLPKAASPTKEGLDQLASIFVRTAESYYTNTTEIANDHATLGIDTATGKVQSAQSPATGAGSREQSAANSIAARESKYGSSKLSPNAQQQLRSTGAKLGRKALVPNRSGQNRNRRRNRSGARAD